MVDRSALEAVYEPGSFGVSSAGVTIHERRGLRIQSVAALAGSSGAPSGLRILTIAPDRWLVVGGDAISPTPGLAINEVGFGRTVIRIEGPAARDVLAKGCPLDFHPSAFGLDRAAQTLLGPFTVLIDCIAPETFDIFLTRSFAEDFWGWLTRAAVEYGYEVELSK